MRIFKKVAGLAACAFLGFSGAALAEGGDSSSDAAEGWTNMVKASKGVIIQVPINEQGEELTSAAVMRIHTGEGQINVQSNTADIARAFNEAVPVDESVPTVTDADVSRDSSTWGWRGGWRGWGGGWGRGYYNSYRPYYYGGYGYGYGYGYGGNPYYYSNYGGYSYGGYGYYGSRYYYYPC